MDDVDDEDEDGEQCDIQESCIIDDDYILCHPILSLWSLYINQTSKE